MAALLPGPAGAQQLTGAGYYRLLQQADTTFPVQRGQRLQVHAHTGSIAVTAWNRDAVRVVAESDQRVELDVDAGGRPAMRHHRGIAL